MQGYLDSLFSLEGRVALVTGATGALGGAMARGLALAGARVAVMGRRAERAEEMAAERQQSRVVARDEDLEGDGAATPDHGDHAFVGLQPQERRAGMQADSSRVSKCRNFQEG